MSLARPLLEPVFELAWKRLPESVREVLASDDERVFRVLTGSSFVLGWIASHPRQFLSLHETDWLIRTHGVARMRRELASALEGAVDEAGLSETLRRVRQQQMVRIIWRDLAGDADLEATMEELSDLADCVLDAALERIYGWACERYGTPTGTESGTRQRMIVLGLGKLGARELNLSSDVDLIFCYPESGATRGKRVRMDNREFFIRLGRSLVRLLEDVTDEGFVFRVDMRLRPFGDVGALCLSIPAMEAYYEQQGRDWERYALIKARVVAGDIGAGEALLDALRPFVYRRYLDFSAVDALREMKRLIESERAGPRYARDVKLGRGGIREVEFIAQLFQLIWGGRDTELQARGLVTVLRRLEQSGRLGAEPVDQLIAAYAFLRRLEHRLQAVHDQQTHLLPDADDERGWARLAYAMGFGDVASFSAELERHRQRVSTHFDALISVSDATPLRGDVFEALWGRELEQAEARRVLGEAGFSDPDAALERLEKLRGARASDVKQDVGRARLDALMPHLLRAAVQTDNPQAALEGALVVVATVLRRTAYLVLLSENLGALGQLMSLCAQSRWIAEELARHPILLDELLDPAALYTVPDRHGLDEELTRRLANVAPDDIERQMEALGVFKQAHALRVAACEVTGVLPLMRVSDYLTFLAESILDRVLHMTWSAMVERHGTPRGAPGVSIVVVGYGKLGGIELGPRSDLDIVFLHDLESDGTTAGPDVITNGQFLNRLVRRVIHVLTAQTLHGRLYEVDVRLRPSGRAGLLVSPLASFESYQTQEAWTFEHQALVRARAVAGDATLMGEFEEIRKRVLCRERDRTRLLHDVVSMRARIADEKGASGEDLKVGAGGMVDIEFMVQYIVLAWASRYPSLIRYSDNVRILEAAASEGLMSLQDAGTLHDAYLALRDASHRRQLGGDVARDEAKLEEHQRNVREVWNRTMMNRTEDTSEP